MNALVKTVLASELPASWQAELALPADRQVKISIQELPPKRSPQEIERMQKRLNAIKPVKILGDVTAFIREERERIDGRT
jgi:hypothetical protein